MNTAAIIPAAGAGILMRSDIPKTFLGLQDKPVLAHTLQAMEGCPEIDSVVVVIAAEYVEKCRRDIVGRYGFKKVTQVVAGGRERQDSVYNGLQAVPPETEIVAVHDGARPLVTPALLSLSVQEARRCGAVLVGVPLKDTVKEVSEAGIVLSTLKRERLWAAQTPQTFRYDLLKSALDNARQSGFFFFFEASLVERLGHPVKIIPGTSLNLKITVPEDMILAEAILNSRDTRYEIRDTKIPFPLRGEG